MSSCVLALEGRLGVEVAADLHVRMRAALAGGRPVRLEAEGLLEVDAAIVQLLYAFVREAEHRGLEWRWRGRSGPLSEAARLCGLYDALFAATARGGEAA